ncbi:hypothetical protein chiPu_0022804, partial [Chiloscyllium punctatum]|nr:hypothetical protein [Chiloscyllium punctatum]
MRIGSDRGGQRRSLADPAGWGGTGTGTRNGYEKPLLLRGVHLGREAAGQFAAASGRLPGNGP